MEKLKEQVTKLLQASFGPYASTALPSELDAGTNELAVASEGAVSLCGTDGDAQVCSAASHVASSDSIASYHSWLSGAGGGGFCFTRDTLFEVPDDATQCHVYVAASDLHAGCRVLSANGTLLEVRKIKKQQTDVLIELCADGVAPLKVTPSHRVLVPSGCEQPPQEVNAETLRPGTFILCTNHTAKKVTNVQRLNERAEVLAITFNPDEAVEVFMHPSEMILTKGQVPKSTRRSGMNRRSNAPVDQLSIPDTAPGDYQD